jgi:hypothetical protein
VVTAKFTRPRLDHQLNRSRTTDLSKAAKTLTSP